MAAVVDHNIIYVNQLFADLGTLIVEQGTMLDRIDGIVEETIELRTLPTVDLPELLLPVITVKPEIFISEF